MFMEDRKTADIVQILLIRHNLYIYAYVLSTPYSFGVLFCIYIILLRFLIIILIYIIIDLF